MSTVQNTAATSPTSQTPASTQATPTDTNSNVDQRIPASELDPTVTDDEASLVAEMFSQDFNPADETTTIVPSSEAPLSELPAPQEQAPVTAAPEPAVVPPEGQPAAAAPQVPQPAAPAPQAQQQPPVVSGAAPNVTETQPLQTGQPLEQLREEVEKNREVFTKALAESVYQLSDVEREALEADPVSTVPQLLAKSHLNIVQNILGVLSAQLPTMVGAIQEARTQHSALEDKFYTKWPQLDRSKDHATVMQLAAAYRKINPQADFDTTVQMVGAQAVVALNRLPAQGTPAPQQQQVQRPAGFVPAANGTVAPVAPVIDNNVFAAMNEAMLHDE